MVQIALNRNLYHNASIYAKQHNTSLTEIVETYLIKLIQSADQSKSPTRSRLESRIKELEALPTNWDKEGAISISPKVCKETTSVLNACNDNQLDGLAIFPSRNGNIFMQWETTKGDACLAISEKGMSYDISIGEKDSYGQFPFNQKNLFLEQLNQIL